MRTSRLRTGPMPPLAACVSAAAWAKLPLWRMPPAMRLIVHRPQKVLCVLKIIFSCDQIALQRFSASQLHVALVIPLCVVRLPRAARSDEVAFPRPCSSRHGGSCKINLRRKAIADDAFWSGLPSWLPQSAAPGLWSLRPSGPPPSGPRRSGARRRFVLVSTMLTARPCRVVRA